jgi:CHAT domain
VTALVTLASVGLTVPALARTLAKVTAADQVPTEWRDIGLIAEWLEVALPKRPRERMQWQQRKKELAAELQALDAPIREALIDDYLSRLIDRWGGAPPMAALEAPAAAAEPTSSAPEPTSPAPVPTESPVAARPAPLLFSRRIGVFAVAAATIAAAMDRLRPTRIRRSRSRETNAPVDVLASEPEALAEPEPRYLNLAVTDTAERELPQTETLLPKSAYLVQLDVGPSSEMSIVVGAEPFDVSPLKPDTPEGYWLDAVVTSADVDVEPAVCRFFLPIAGPSWVCDCRSIGHTCTPSERRAHLYVPFRTRDAGAATLRCTIYHGNHVVQSARVELTVADGGRRATAQHAEVDYTLSANFADVAALPRRDVSVLTNETLGGVHSVVIKVDGRPIPVNISEAVAGSTIRDIREQLSLITVGPDGKSPQFGSNNEKPRDELIQDLEQLATLGARLWERVTPDGGDYDYVRDKLRKRSTIQVARVQGAVFPWALVYDIGNEAFQVWERCQLLDEHDLGGMLATYPEECPFAAAHHRNVLCPYGFWGYRHLLEQPPSRPLVTNIPLRKGARAAVVWNLALDPDHVEKMSGCLTRFAVSDCDSRDDLIRAIADPLLPLVYFYCHGKTAVLANTNEALPYLEIGKNDRIAPGDFRAWADDGVWDVTYWNDVPPLVFINGCSTTAITPEGVVNFVDKLVQVGAAGVVGTEIAVAEKTAGEIGIRFYGYFAGAGGGSVGDALYRTRIDMLGKGNVSGLVYTAFCSMGLELKESA